LSMNHRSVGVFTGYFGPIRDVCRRTATIPLLRVHLRLHCQLPISANWTFFASSHVLLERGWVSLSTNFRRNVGRPPTTIGARKLESLGYYVALFARSYV